MTTTASPLLHSTGENHQSLHCTSHDHREPASTQHMGQSSVTALYLRRPPRACFYTAHGTIISHSIVLQMTTTASPLLHSTQDNRQSLHCTSDDNHREPASTQHTGQSSVTALYFSRVLKMTTTASLLLHSTRDNHQSRHCTSDDNHREPASTQHTGQSSVTALYFSRPPRACFSTAHRTIISQTNLLTYLPAVTAPPIKLLSANQLLPITYTSTIKRANSSDPHQDSLYRQHCYFTSLVC